MNEIPELPVETVIERTHGLRLVSWRDLHAYRDLLWLLVWRDITARYKQTVLGLLWFVVQPMATTAIFIVIFAIVARIPTNGVPSSLFYLSGLLPWNYFAQTFQSTSGSLANNAGMFGKVYFPRLIVPLSGRALQRGDAPDPARHLRRRVRGRKTRSPAGTALDSPPPAGCCRSSSCRSAMISLGVGLWVAALAAKFRDFAVLAGFVLQLWMYATPVVFPLSRVPARYLWAAGLNPMTYPLEAVRQMLLGAGTPNFLLGLESVGLTVLTLATGLLVFQQVEKNFVDVI